MRCAKCGGEVKPTDPCCPYCAQTRGDMRTPGGMETKNEGNGEKAGAGHGVFFRKLIISRRGLWPTVLGAAILLTVLIFALPLALIGMLIFAVYRCLIRRGF